MRVAIVNDLSLAREVLRRALLSTPEHTVVWMAENGQQAIDKAAVDRPDVILMDLVMPEVDGVEATRRIMSQTPCPILLVTSSVASNFNKVFQALSSGALDAVNTPILRPDGTVQGSEDILRRLAQLQQELQKAPCRLSGLHGLPPRAGEARSVQPGAPLVTLGASTGGPQALAQVLGGLPATFPASVLIIQHIAAEYAGGLAEWLQHETALPVRLAQEGDPLQEGTVYLARTNDHLVVDDQLCLHYTAEPVHCPYRPSVDALFSSLAQHWPEPGVAVLLTGMMTDGAAGMARLCQAGWATIAQDEATCVVYGMPRAAVQQGAAREVLPLSEIAPALIVHGERLLRQRAARRKE
jgi:two-component system response regulator WspF